MNGDGDVGIRRTSTKCDGGTVGRKQRVKDTDRSSETRLDGGICMFGKEM